MKDITTEEALNILKTISTDNFCMEQIKIKQAIEKVLNELETLQNGLNTAVEHQTELIRENTNFRYQLFNNKKELEKKDRIIDAMTKEWFELDTLFMIRGKNIHSAEELKQYFERKEEDE